MNVNCTPSTRNEKKTTTGVMKMISQLLLAFVFLTIGNVAFGQNYTGLDGGFEGTATIDNSTTYTTAQTGKWTKNNASTTIADETSVVRSGGHALSITNSTTTGRRVWSPLTTQSSTTGQTTISFWRRVTSIATNFQQSMAGVGNGTTTDASSGTYAVPSAINTWEKVTYTRTSWTYTDIAGVIFTRLQGSGTFYVYIDDLVVYPGAADVTAPNAATVPVIGTPTSSSLPVSWTGASGGVDGGGYLVVRHTADPTTAPNANGIYAVGNTIGSGTVVYQGTSTSFTDVSLSPGTTYYYRIYTYDKAYNYSGALTTNGTTSGGGSSTPPTLTAAGGATVDAAFNVTFTDDATWRAAITSITVGGTTLTAGYTVSSGQITFTPSASNPAGLLQTSGANKSIVITATGYTNATVSQTIGAGVANKLEMSVQPAAPASNGAALATQPVVFIRDQYGNATTSTATVTANVGAGSWTIGGTTGIAGVSGTATFTNLTATSAAAVTGATISFTSSGLTGVTSGTFNIPAPAPANDLCSNAVTLTIGAAATNGTLAAATNSNTFGYAATKTDVWYKFTPTCTQSYTITLNFAGSPTADIDFDVFTGPSCPTSGTAPVTAHGTTGTETATASFTAGTTYLIRVIDYNATGTAFDIAIAAATPPLALSNGGTPVAGLVAQGATNVTLYGFTLTPSSCTSSFDFTAASITTSGSATSSDLSNFRLYYDANGDGAYDVADVLLGTIATIANPLNFNSISGQTGITSARKYILVANVAAGATPGRTFTGTMANTDVSSNVTVSGSAAGNAMTVQGVAPTLTAAGSATVDAPFSITFTDNATWRAGITSISVGGTTLTAGYTVSAGQITFTPSASVPTTLLQTAGTKNIVVIATGYANTSVSQTIGVGAASKLGMWVQPGNVTSNGSGPATSPVIRVYDQYNNLVSSATPNISATVGAGTWTIGGTTSVTATGGEAQFLALTATSAAAVSGATITFSASGLTSVTSSTFTIAAPDFISLNAVNSAVTENFDGMGTGTTTSVGFSIQDGNTSTTTTSLSAQASSGTPATGGSYNWGQSSSERALGLMYSSGYNTKSVLVKVKNNTGAAVDNFTLSFKYEQYRSNSSTQTFKLQYSTSLTTGWIDVAGGDFSNITTGSSYNFTTLVASQTITNLLFTPSASVANGAVVYFRWILDGSSNSAGVGVDDFSVKAGLSVPAPALNAASGATVDAPFNVTFTDDATWRSAITSVTVGGTPLTAGYTVSAGQITFTPSASVPAGLLQSSGTKTINVIATGYSNTSVSQTIGVGAASKLAITTQPAAPAVNGTVLATQPVVVVQDQYGNTVTGSTATVTAAANTGAGTWTLTGTKVKNAVSGVVTYTDLVANSTTTVTGVSIDFSSPGLTGVSSTTFNIPPPDFINLTATGSTYTQNFNSLGTSATATLPEGFKISLLRGTPANPGWTDGTNNVLATTEIGGTSAAASTGGIYNWGDGVAASATDRALGFLTSNNYPVSSGGIANVGMSVLSRVKNNTGNTLSSVTVTFNYEKYRSGTNTGNWTFYYSTTGAAGSWTAATAGDHTFAADGTSNAAVAATSSGTKTVTLTGLNIADGSDIYFRWSYASGGTNAQGMGVDNFTVTGCRTLSASVASTNTPICNGSNAVFNLTGTPNTTVTYNINGGSNQTVTLNGSGNGTVTITGAAVDQALNFVSITEGGCVPQSLSGTTTVSINTVNTWVGLGDGSSWTDAANWSCGTPDGSTNLAISSGDVVLNTNYTIPSGKSLTLSGTATLTINATSTLTITGTADFGGRPVTLKSTSGSNAGAIGVIGNSGANLTNATAVTVERYIPASRKWRGISSPLSAATPGNSIYNSWQSNGTEIPGEGILLWNATGTGGFSLNSAPSASANIRGYTGGTGFTIPTTTTGTNIISGGKPVPYLVFITDNYRFGANTGNMTTGATATTIKATGTLYKGNYATGTLSSGYHMLPNPYPSPITLSSAVLSSVNDKFWVWDPKLSGFNGYGGYVATTNGVSAPVGVGGSYSTDSRVIPSGGAFWVQSTGSASITLTETLKGGTTFNIYGRQNNGTTEMIRVNLMNSNGDLYDGIAVAYQNDGNAAIDDKDAAKFAMLSENISVKRAGVDLAIEFRPLVDSSDTIFLNLYQLQKKGYVLNISGQGFDVAANLTAVLQDLYLNKETVLNIYGSQTYSFTVDNNAASSGERFRIVFRPSAVTPVTDLVSLKTIKLYPNPVSKGTEVQLQFRNSSAGKYEVTLYNLVGVQVMKQTITHGGGNGVQKLDLPQALAAGTYIAEITDAKGNKGKVKLVIE